MRPRSLYLYLLLGLLAVRAGAAGRPTTLVSERWVIDENGKVSTWSGRVENHQWVGRYRPGAAADVTPAAEWMAGRRSPLEAPERLITVTFRPPLDRPPENADCRVTGPEGSSLALDRFLSHLARFTNKGVRLRGLRPGDYKILLQGDFRQPIELRFNATAGDSNSIVAWENASGVRFRTRGAISPGKLTYRIEGTPRSLQPTAGSEPGGYVYPTIWFRPGQSRTLEYHVSGYARGRVSLDVPLRNLIVVPLGETSSSDLRIDALGHDRRPLEDFRVQVWDDAASTRVGRPSPPALLETEFRSAKGSVLIDDLAAGSYTLLGTADRRPPARLSIQLGRDRRRRIPAMLLFDAGKLFEVNVISPVAATMRVGATVYDADQRLLAEIQGTPEKPPAYSLALPAAASFVRPFALSEELEPESRPEIVPVASGSATIVLRPKPVLDGTVTLRGRAIPAAGVFLRSRAGMQIRTTSDNDGHWRAPVEADEWTVGASDAEGHRSTLHRLEVLPGALPSVELELQEGSSLAGRTMNRQTDLPIPYAELELRELPPSSGFPLKTLFADEEGRFTINAVSGPMNLVARAAGYGTGSVPIRPPSEDAGELLVYLSPEARVELTDFDEFGVPRSGARIALIDASGVSHRDLTDASGTVLFRGLPAGRAQAYEEQRSFLPGIQVVSGGGDTHVMLLPGDYKRVTLGEPGVSVALVADPPRSAGIRVENENGVGKSALLRSDGKADLTLRAGIPWKVSCSTGSSLIPLGSITPTQAGGVFKIQLSDLCPEGYPRRQGSD